MNDTVYELWFKQMLYEIDSVRSLLSQVPFDERKQLVINQRMGRVVGIAKVSCNYNYLIKIILKLNCKGRSFNMSGLQERYMFDDHS